MRPLPKIRKTVKWGGLLIGALIICVWIGSAFGHVQWGSSRGYLVNVGAGMLSITWWPTGHGVSVQSGFEMNAIPAQLSWWFKRSSVMTIEYVGLPLWAPALVMLLCGLAAWRLDSLARRRARLGTCPKCDYDRTGLAPGAVCPECGAAAG